MTSIRYKGEIYVEAASLHKKCAKGSHWNGIRHKCKPLPKDLANKSHSAFQQSKVASHASAKLRGHRLTPNASPHDLHKHIPARNAHEKASSLHWAVADDARKRGFYNLSDTHRSKASYHSRHAVKHGA